MACEVPPRDWRVGITPGRVGVAVVAGTLTVVAIALDTDQIANLLFAAAALLFATQFGVPVATAMEVGHPIASVFAALYDQEHLVTLRGKRQLPILTEIAYYITRDRMRATDLAELAIVDAYQWRGRLARELDNYLLCRAAYLAIIDDLANAPIGDGRSVLPEGRRDRAIVVLRRHGVAPAEVATWLGCSNEEVTAVERWVTAEW
jgi:hypothetical protein